MELGNIQEADDTAVACLRQSDSHSSEFHRNHHRWTTNGARRWFRGSRNLRQYGCFTICTDTTVQTSAAEAVETTFTMAGYPAGHRAMLTSTGSCHLLGGSEDSRVHGGGGVHKNVVGQTLHSRAGKNLRLHLCANDFCKGVAGYW